MLIVIVKRQIPTHLQKIGEKKKERKSLTCFYSSLGESLSKPEKICTANKMGPTNDNMLYIMDIMLWLASSSR